MNNYESLVEKTEALMAELTALAAEEKQLKEGKDRLLVVVQQSMMLLADAGCGCVFGVAAPDGFRVYSNGPYMHRAAAAAMVSQFVVEEVARAATRVTQAQTNEEPEDPCSPDKEVK